MLDRAVLFLIVLNLVADGRQAAGNECPRQCPDGWTYFQDSCYLFVDDRNRAWNDSVIHCSLMDAYLVSINGPEEDAFLQSFTSRLFRNGNDRKGVAFWTGGTDSETESRWMWYTDNDVMTYTNWYPGQPDMHNNTEEDCLMLYGYADFSWHDVPCHFRLYPICELRVGPEENVVEIIG